MNASRREICQVHTKLRNGNTLFVKHKNVHLIDNAKTTHLLTPYSEDDLYLFELKHRDIIILYFRSEPFYADSFYGTTVQSLSDFIVVCLKTKDVIYSSDIWTPFDLVNVAEYPNGNIDLYILDEDYDGTPEEYSHIVTINIREEHCKAMWEKMGCTDKKEREFVSKIIKQSFLKHTPWIKTISDFVNPFTIYMTSIIK